MSSSEHAFAIVESVESDGLRLKFDGEDAAGEKKYKCNTFFKFSAGDRVYCVKDSGTYVAICKIGEPAKEIRADTAESAEEAETAKSAEIVEKAENAEGILFQGNSIYKLKLREGTAGNKAEYSITYDGQSLPTWYLLGAPYDEAATYQTGTAVVRFRSTGDGKLQFLLPYRNSYTWYTIATV